MANLDTNALLTSVPVIDILLVVVWRSSTHWSRFFNFSSKNLSKAIPCACTPDPTNLSLRILHNACPSPFSSGVILFPTNATIDSIVFVLFCALSTCTPGSISVSVVVFCVVSGLSIVILLLFTLSLC
ncbi:hypothetical protein O181_097052 [Austropuccinia psidii MF-1]|uniref:Transmembrane protein n=1 Tax=Austropuccinia psidii MF-1 TaxID=1389203 RepID=A0A9Q3J7U1_9BASI|nr:hypothetical protein [Austropuccinia psidii MF-1]